jgi:predicted phosphohydrolase
MAPSLTRRAAITGALGAAAGTAALARQPVADAAGAGLYLGPGLEPELVTVTDTSMVAWWRTDDPADTTVRITPVGGPDDGVTRELRLEERETVHVARVDGLVPGQRYRYALFSGGQRVSLGIGAADPGSFVTLQPPAGRRLATIALINDLHVGEHCSGKAFDLGDVPVPPCLSADAYPDYAHRMVAAAVDELAAMPLDLVVANGDLTDRGRPEDIDRALAQLRRFPSPVLITRGNHDRRLPGACPPDGDCLRAGAFPSQPAGDGTLRSLVRVGRRLAVLGLDSTDPDEGGARLDLGDQAAWLDDGLRAVDAEGRDAIVAFHHPLLSPQGVAKDDGAGAILDVLARHPHVRLVVHGHTHSNALRTHRPTGDLPFLENGAIKEYPAGYCLLHVYEGGIMRTFHRPTNAWAREWTAASAGQIWGLQPTTTRGALDTRAFVLHYDSRGDRPGTEDDAPPAGPGAGSGTAVAGVSAVAVPGVVAGASTDPGASGRRRGPEVSSLRQVSLTKLRRRGMVVGVHVPEDADVEVRLVASLGRRDGLRRPRSATLASVRRRSAAGTVRLRLRPGTVGRVLLRPVERHLHGAIEVVVRPRTGGTTRRLRRRVRLLHRR